MYNFRNSYGFGIVIPSIKDNTLKFNHYIKSGKMLYIIYDNLESQVKKIDWCINNLEKYLQLVLHIVFVI